MASDYLSKNMKVAIIVYSSESSQQIANVLKYLNVPYHLYLIDDDGSQDYDITHIILSGGPEHVYDKNSAKIPNWVMLSSLPVLGICYGAQLIAYSFGGSVTKLKTPELKVMVNITEVIHGQFNRKNVYMNRYDTVTVVPNNFKIIGVGPQNDIVNFTDFSRWHGIQYHPEKSGHEDYDVFRRFLK